MTITLRNCMKSSHNSFIQAAGLSFTDIPYIGFHSRVWHVSKYNKAGMTDSLMTHPADEESDNVRLIELTVDKLNRDQKESQEVVRRVGLLRMEAILYHTSRPLQKR